MTSLLDVNVLIALGWPNHVHHQAARRWFRQSAASGWATTPITEIGFVRISSNSAAMRVSTTPSKAISLLTQLIALPGHQFWPDTVPLVIGADTECADVTTHRAVTDAHLVALARIHTGQLVTFDSALAESAVASAVYLVPTD